MWIVSARAHANRLHLWVRQQLRCMRIERRRGLLHSRRSNCGCRLCAARGRGFVRQAAPDHRMGATADKRHRIAAARKEIQHLAHWIPNRIGVRPSKQ